MEFDKELIQRSYGFCESLATSHYENFPVGSVLIPRKVRRHFFAVYAFSRMADDIADEKERGTREERITGLSRYRALISERDKYVPGMDPEFFPALYKTIDECRLPQEPFLRLLEAFRRDVLFKQPDSWYDVMDYCTFSANPVGELVLRLFDLWNETTAPLSDKICTALQLANFWQDFSRDIPAGRVYIPSDILQKYELKAEDLVKENLERDDFCFKFVSCLRQIYVETETLFAEGKKLIKHLKPLRLRLEIKATVGGGEQIMRKLDKLGARALTVRPALTTPDIMKIFLTTLV